MPATEEPMVFVNEDAGVLAPAGTVTYVWNVTKFQAGRLFGSVISDQSGQLDLVLESQLNSGENPLLVPQDTVVAINFAYTFLVRPILPYLRLVFTNTGGAPSTFTRVSMQGVLL